MATFRLRKPGPGSTLRGGDGLRADDKRIFEYAASGGIVFSGDAAVSAIKVHVGTGGIEYAGDAIASKTKSFDASGGAVFGGAGITDFVDGRGYVGTGGIRYGGSAVASFIQQEAPPAHGRGSYLTTRTPSIPIKRRQYGHPVKFEHLASGGIHYGGKAETERVRYSVAHLAPLPSGGIAHGGAATTAVERPEEELLLLLAA